MPLVVDDARETYPSWSSDGQYLLFERVATQPNSHQGTNMSLAVGTKFGPYEIQSHVTFLLNFL